MAGKAWPSEVNRWLVENIPGRTSKEVTELINRQGFDERYGMTFTVGQIKSAKNRLHIKSGTPGGIAKGTSFLYPDGMEDYIRSIATGRKAEEIARMTSEHFGISFTARQCKAYKKNHDIKSGLDCRFTKGHAPYNKGVPMRPEVYEKARATMFKKGNVPANHREVGDISKTTDGYPIIKVKEDGTQRERWQFLHRHVWEQYNGPIPEGKLVSFLDGNKDNCSIENLTLIDNDVNLELNRRGHRSEFPEITQAGVALAAYKVAAVKKKRGKHEEHDQRKDAPES